MNPKVKTVRYKGVLIPPPTASRLPLTSGRVSRIKYVSMHFSTVIYVIQTSIAYIKNVIQNSIENNLLGKIKKEKSFGLHVDRMKKLLTMNPMEKH